MFARKLSLLNLAKSTDMQIALTCVKVVYNKIALLLHDLVFAYHINKERRDFSARDLHRLAKLQFKQVDF